MIRFTPSVVRYVVVGTLVLMFAVCRMTGVPETLPRPSEPVVRILLSSFLISKLWGLLLTCNPDRFPGCPGLMAVT